MKAFIVCWHHHIAGGSDHVCVMAKDEREALQKGKPMLNTHKLHPDFLNNYGMYYVYKA